jgi:hypothetical protein
MLQNGNGSLLRLKVHENGSGLKTNLGKKRHLNTLWESKGNTHGTFKMNSHFKSWEF